MTLDKNRKYEFAGDVYSWTGKCWGSGIRNWTTFEFQYFADNKLVKVVSEPIVGRGRVEFGCLANVISAGYWFQIIGITEDQARNRTFDIVATEVVE